MNINETQRVIDYLKDKASHTYILRPDGAGFLNVTVDDFPEEITGNPAVLETLNRVANITAASQYVKTPGKPLRLEKKIYELVEALHDPHIIELLNMKLTPEKAGQIIEDIEQALGYEKTPYETTVEYTPPKLTPPALAEFVAHVLRENGFMVNASSGGLLVRTLKSIGKAANFKTNAQQSARDICKK